MLKILQRVEDRIAALEGSLLTIIVLVMLSLAVYNVFYRNILVPIQAKVTISAVATVQPPANEPSSAQVKPSESDNESFGGGFGSDPAAADDDGFGGGFGGGFGSEVKPAEDPGAGFGGGFGSEEKPAEDPGAGFGGGFGGGFGSDNAAASESESDDGFGGGFGGGFGDAKPTAEAPPADSPKPAPADSVVAEPTAFVAAVDRFVLALRVEWIDVLLRHLVLVCGFLGAMLATRRRKHITIDALSKVLPAKVLPYADGVTAALSAFICVILAISGWDFVKIGLEFPKELAWWADEWVFQLVFPIGFGLLAFHFLVRVAESVGELVEAKS